MTHDPQNSYDSVADEYASKFLQELDYKPFDREQLDRLAQRTAGKGRVLDLGCGPGQIAHYLKTQGADAFGIDLSPGMVEQAQKANPDIPFQQGDMKALDLPDNTLAGIAAFYSIIHIPREEVTDVLKELRRVLQPDGLLLLTFHVGDEVVHLDEWWGRNVAVDFTFFGQAEMEGYLKAADLLIEESTVRPPYPQEHPSQRGYILSRKAV